MRGAAACAAICRISSAVCQSFSMSVTLPMPSGRVTRSAIVFISHTSGRTAASTPTTVTPVRMATFGT